MFKTHRTFDLTTGVKSKTIAVFRDADAVSVVYHKTTVFKAYRSGCVELNNGGWDTVSTRAVINQALSESGLLTSFLFRKKNVTYLTHDGVTSEFKGMAQLNAKPATKLQAVG